MTECNSAAQGYGGAAAQSLCTTAHLPNTGMTLLVIAAVGLLLLLGGLALRQIRA